VKKHNSNATTPTTKSGLSTTIFGMILPVLLIHMHELPVQFVSSFIVPLRNLFDALKRKNDETKRQFQPLVFLERTLILLLSKVSEGIEKHFENMKI